jgi:hypothetical protein
MAACDEYEINNTFGDEDNIERLSRLCNGMLISAATYEIEVVRTR